MAKTPLEIASLAGMHTKKAVKTLAAIMNEPRAPYAARVAAAEALLDRGWGRAKQTHESEIRRRYVIGGDWQEAPAPQLNAKGEARLWQPLAVDARALLLRVAAGAAGSARAPILPPRNGSLTPPRSCRMTSGRFPCPRHAAKRRIRAAATAALL